MLTKRLRASREANDDGGFSLIELLVVIIIIGILAAVAIPIYLNQRKKAVDASAKVDLRVVANAEETYFADYRAYSVLAGSAPSYTLGPAANQIPVRSSPGSALAVTPDSDGPGTYCVTVTNSNASQVWVYKSAGGGIQVLGVTTC